MEVCVPSSKSPYLDGCSSRGPLKIIPLKTSQNNPTDLSVSDLKTCLTEVLVRDGIDVKKSEDNDVSNVIWGHEINKKDLEKNKSAHSASENLEPSSSIVQFLVDKQEHDATNANIEVTVSANSVDQPRLQLKPLPNTSKPLSALKGSRAKQGMPPKKLSVTWAPDVYDPIPSSVSHVPSSSSSKDHHYRSHGKRKNKHKRGGKSSRSSGSKHNSREKKQTRKNVGTTSKLKPMHDYGRGNEAFTEPIEDLNPFCGSSLLLKNSTDGFSTAEEAT